MYLSKREPDLFLRLLFSQFCVCISIKVLFFFNSMLSSLSHWPMEINFPYPLQLWDERFPWHSELPDFLKPINKPEKYTAVIVITQVQYNQLSTTSQLWQQPSPTAALLLSASLRMNHICLGREGEWMNRSSFASQLSHTKQDHF